MGWEELILLFLVAGGGHLIRFGVVRWGVVLFDLSWSLTVFFFLGSALVLFVCVCVCVFN